jgi:hypothetical protein
MSFDVYLEHPHCEHCGRRDADVFWFNLTHNVNCIVDACLVAGGATRAKNDEQYYVERSWGRLNGWRAGDLIDILTRAAQVANDPDRADEFRAMEPDNGWGTLDSVRRKLDELLEACRANPSAFIRASG